MKKSELKQLIREVVEEMAAKKAIRNRNVKPKAPQVEKSYEVFFRNEEGEEVSIQVDAYSKEGAIEKAIDSADELFMDMDPYEQDIVDNYSEVEAIEVK